MSPIHMGQIRKAPLSQSDTTCLTSTNRYQSKTTTERGSNCQRRTDPRPSELMNQLGSTSPLHSLLWQSRLRSSTLQGKRRCQRKKTNRRGRKRHCRMGRPQYRREESEWRWVSHSGKNIRARTARYLSETRPRTNSRYPLHTKFAGLLRQYNKIAERMQSASATTNQPGNGNRRNTATKAAR